MFKIFFNSIPKAGTNLMIKCLKLLGAKRVGSLISGFMGPFVGNLPRFNKYVTLLNWRIQKTYARLFDHQIGYLAGIVHPSEKSRYLVDYLIDMVKPGEYLQAHVGFTDELLINLAEENFRSIVMIRDPRAILLSRLHYISRTKHNKLYGRFRKLSFEGKIILLLNGYNCNSYSVQSMPSICNSLSSWIDKESVLLVKFENLIGPKGGGTRGAQLNTIREISEFIGAYQDSNKIESVSEQLFGGTHTFRKGTTDSWKEEIPLLLKEEMEEKLGKALKEWKYEM